MTLFLTVFSLSCAAGSEPAGNSFALKRPTTLVNSEGNRRSDYGSYVAWRNALDPRTFPAPVGRNAYGAPKSTVTIPMHFPILGRGYSFSDEFGAPRNGHRHLGQDLFAPKLTPVVATFDGTVYFWGGSGIAPANTITVIGDNGYTAKYMHINNDRPGTNDGLGGLLYAFAPGLTSGQRVKAGQFLGWVGNSGNAETTPPHVHFELWGPDGMVINPTTSLRKAVRLKQATAEIPLPEWQPTNGETRWDGVVQQVDTKRGVVVLQLLATTTNKTTVAHTRPGLTYVRVAPTTVIRQDGTGGSLRFGDLRPGDRIALRGPLPTKKRPFVARLAAVPTDADGNSTYATGEREGRSLGGQIRDWWSGVRRRGRL